jgi:predicted MFS family arabinose efflux permease
MRADLGWSFANAGAMNTANAAGYLVGALAAAPLGKQRGDKPVFVVSLLLTSLTVGASGLTANFAILLALRLAAGFTGALAFVSGAALTSAAAVGGSKSRAPTLLGLYFSGAGIGVVASAIAVPPLLETLGWRGGWLILSMLSLAATLFGGLVTRHAPEPSYSSAGSTARRGWSPRFMACKLLAYGLFGAGYIAYATFIVAYLRSEEGFSSTAITVFWSILGLASVVAVFAWGPILGRLKGGRGTAATLAGVMIGAAVPLIWQGAAGAYLSAVLFGGSFLAVLAAVTSFARRAAMPHAWTAAIAALTIAFGLGQCIGPVLSGALSDGASGLRAGLWLSVGILAVAIFVAMLQSEPATPE